jgi:hypothetical protein
METLKQRISTGMALFNEVVWHERSRAMKAAVMNVLGHSLQTGRRLFVYSGAAHSTTSELGGTFDGIRHTVLEV